MPESTNWVELVKELGPVLGVLAVVLGTILAGLFQVWVARRQSKDAHKSQLALIERAHAQQIALLKAQQDREEDLRVRQFAESDRADQLVVVEYVDLLLPRLCDATSIYYLGSDNRDEEELKKYQQIQRYMQANELDPAHPEATLGLRMTFLLFQLSAAMRLALNARWTRPLSVGHARFLANWEDNLEPIICSGRYPGKELLYREQIEILTEQMLTVSKATNIPRPLNWQEFCTKYASDPVLRDLADQVAGKIRYIFDESNALPPRRATQCRLAIMALYLIHLTKDAGNDSWNRREDGLWKVVANWFHWEREQGQCPRWFVFEQGDVEKRLPASTG